MEQRDMTNAVLRAIGLLRGTIDATTTHGYTPGDLEMIAQEAKQHLVGLNQQEVAAVTLVVASIASFAIANVADLVERPAASVFEQMIARAIVCQREDSQ